MAYSTCFNVYISLLKSGGFCFSDLLSTCCLLGWKHHFLSTTEIKEKKPEETNKYKTTPRISMGIQFWEKFKGTGVLSGISQFNNLYIYFVILWRSFLNLAIFVHSCSISFFFCESLNLPLSLCALNVQIWPQSLSCGNWPGSSMIQ